MADDTDFERISRKAYEIWESEGRPHGRDQAHWDQAKEIVALHDSMGDTLLPRDAGAFEPEEPREAVENYGDMPGLADQGRDDLTDTGREPEFTQPGHATHASGGNDGHVARAPRVPADGAAAEDADEEVVTPAPKVAAVTPTPSNPTLGVPAPRGAAGTEPDRPQAVTPKTADVPTKASASAAGPGLDIAPAGNGAATSGTTPAPAASPSGARAPAGMASAATSGAASRSGLPPTATAAGRPATAPGDARTGAQASPAGNGAQVTGRNPPRPGAAPASVTKGKPPQGRR